MSTSHDAATSDKGEKKRSFTMSFKYEEIEYAERESNRAAAKKYKVEVKRIREWRQNKRSIKELKEKQKGQGRERLEGGGRKVIDDNLDEIILEWIHGRGANGLRVSRKTLVRRKMSRR